MSTTSTPVAGDWLADPAYWQELFQRLTRLVSDFAAARPDSDGLPMETARQRLGLPDLVLVKALVRPPLDMRSGRIVHEAMVLPQALVEPVRQVRDMLRLTPFRAPEALRLLELDLGQREIRRAVRAGLLLHLDA